MTDPVQRGFITFLSAWLLVHETAHEVIEDFVEKGRLPESGEDGYLSDLARQVAEERDNLKAKLRMPGTMPGPARKHADTSQAPRSSAGPDLDIEALLARLDRLEGQLAVLDSRLEALSGPGAASRSGKG